MKKVVLVWAMDRNWLIGDKNKLPWNYPKDIKHFKNLTKNKAVIMGMMTYNSMKEYYKGKPLPFHIIYVADEWNNEYDDAITIPDIKWFMNNIKDEIYVIGGATIYRLTLPYADELYITHIDAEHEGDVYMERFDLDGEFDLVESTKIDNLTFNKYVRKSKETQKADPEVLNTEDDIFDGVLDAEKIYPGMESDNND
jgi:dihydrofolate reductase